MQPFAAILTQSEDQKRGLDEACVLQNLQTCERDKGSLLGAIPLGRQTSPLKGDEWDNLRTEMADLIVSD
jgi:hypothetical protein